MKDKRNNIFVNPLLLPLLCEISGALHLVDLQLFVRIVTAIVITIQVKHQLVLLTFSAQIKNPFNDDHNSIYRTV